MRETGDSGKGRERKMYRERERKKEIEIEKKERDRERWSERQRVAIKLYSTVHVIVKKSNIYNLKGAFL